MDALGLGLTLGLAASISPGPLLVLVVTSALRSGWRAGALAACAPLLSDAVVVAATLLLLDRLPASVLGVLGVVGAVFVVWTGAQTIRDARSASVGTTATHFGGTDVTAGRSHGGAAGDGGSIGDGAVRDGGSVGDGAAGKDAGDGPAGGGPAGGGPAGGGPAGGGQAGHGVVGDGGNTGGEVGSGSGSGKGRGGAGDRRSAAGGSGRGSGDASALRRAVAVNLLSPHPWLAWATALGPLVIATWRGSPGAGVALLVGFYLTLVGGKVVIALLVARGRRRLGDVGYRRALTCAGVLLVLAGVALGVEFAGYGM
ncbi:threonine/homoserine/homoserine lactone efflux protein [Saccharothrix tamanrassetensis]|uniref:Threonine/homoserine/homoserine lactone efflux protein n=1 Tax=Saccharothrix tamanrassetensis TaxID=1051531 RepID=A0A841CDM9_9PSEU|nr:LysE family transporter [Saccharothrix tamanrassetensis]MBB5954135.1 threonine/homoserine/homoserine lactone efflux protein [Saccharothrix tamanrassetensis]